MNKPYETVRQEALDALLAGDAQQAFSTFRWTLQYPGAPELEDRARWKDAFDIFARISAAIAGDEFSAFVRRAANEPDDIQALYELGYQLLEQSLHGIGATVLLRAHRLAPDEEPLLSELCAALEGYGYNAEAARLLRAAPNLVEQSFLCRYLLAFNALMSGEFDEPRRLLPGLERLRGQVEDKGQATTFALMEGRVREMLARVDAVRGSTPLDANDLRGWHFVITGGVLLHLSPFGFDEGMRGRYAFTQDSEARCLEGIRRVEAVLRTVDMKPPRVFVLPERSSAILAHAMARVLGVPIEPWPTEGSDAPGLIVAYDASELEVPVLQTLHPHRPGQLLWSHAMCWTQEPPFGPDLVTYLYQVNHSPWGERLRFTQESQRMENQPPVEGPAEELAGTVVSAALEEGALEDLPTLTKLVSAMVRVKGDAAGGLFREQGFRRRMLTDSPVKSNRFA